MLHEYVFGPPISHCVMFCYDIKWGGAKFRLLLYAQKHQVHSMNDTLIFHWTIQSFIFKHDNGYIYITLNNVTMDMFPLYLVRGQSHSIVDFVYKRSIQRYNIIIRCIYFNQDITNTNIKKTEMVLFYLVLIYCFIYTSTPDRRSLKILHTKINVSLFK